MKPVDPELLSRIADTDEYDSIAYQVVNNQMGNLYSNIYAANNLASIGL